MSENLILPDDPRPTRADAVKNHQILISTARRLFDEHGVEVVTMTEIAKEAGVGKGTLYRHFSDKAALCHELIDQQMRELQERTLNYLRATPDPLEGLHWFMEQAIGFVDHNMELLCEASNHAAVSMLEHPAHLWWRQTILGLLQRCDVITDTQYAADLLYVALDVQTIQFQRTALGYSMERLLDGLHQTLDSLLKPS